MRTNLSKYILFSLLSLITVFFLCLPTQIAAQERVQSQTITMREMIVKDGKMAEAVSYFKEYRDYINAKFPDQNMRVYFEFFGDAGKVYWIVEYKNLATFEAVFGQMMFDPAFHTINNKGNGLFVEGSIHDTLMNMLR